MLHLLLLLLLLMRLPLLPPCHAPASYCWRRMQGSERQVVASGLRPALPRAARPSPSAAPTDGRVPAAGRCGAGAQVKLVLEQTDEDLAFLMAHDTDRLLSPPPTLPHRLKGPPPNLTPPKPIRGQHLG